MLGNAVVLCKRNTLVLCMRNTIVFLIGNTSVLFIRKTFVLCITSSTPSHSHTQAFEIVNQRSRQLWPVVMMFNFPRWYFSIGISNLSIQLSLWATSCWRRHLFQDNRRICVVVYLSICVIAFEDICSEIELRLNSLMAVYLWSCVFVY